MSRHIVVLSGSNRGDSQSLKVARYLRQRLTDLNLCDASDLIDLAACRLPLWPEKDRDEVWLAQQSILAKATALIVISPEWNGMACPALKNFFLYAGINELGHKPALCWWASRLDLAAPIPSPSCVRRATRIAGSRICRNI